MISAHASEADVAHIKGLLSGLEPKLQKKILRKALRAGCKVIHADMKANVPVGKPEDGDEHPGLLRRKLTVRAAKGRKRGRIAYQVVIKDSEELQTTTKEGVQHFYPAVLEFGTEDREAEPFMRPSFDRKQGEALEVAKKEIASGVLEAATSGH